jgi:hypothetical protein
MGSTQHSDAVLEPALTKLGVKTCRSQLGVLLEPLHEVRFERIDGAHCRKWARLASVVNGSTDDGVVNAEASGDGPDAPVLADHEAAHLGARGFVDHR